MTTKTPMMTSDTWMKSGLIYVILFIYIHGCCTYWCIDKPRSIIVPAQVQEEGEEVVQLVRPTSTRRMGQSGEGSINTKDHWCIWQLVHCKAHRQGSIKRMQCRHGFWTTIMFHIPCCKELSPCHQSAISSTNRIDSVESFTRLDQWVILNNMIRELLVTLLRWTSWGTSWFNPVWTSNLVHHHFSVWTLKKKHSECQTISELSAFSIWIGHSLN